MKIDEQVTSLEVSVQLMDLGVKQESLFYWISTLEGFEIVYQGKDMGETSISAFTVAELGKMLPRAIDSKWFLRFKPNKYTPQWEVNYVGKKGKDMTFRYSKMTEGIKGNTEADARGNMLIYLIEHDLTDTYVKY